MNMEKKRLFTLYLVRHAQSCENAGISGDFHPDDAPLTEKGLAQAEKIKEYFESRQVDAIYTSTLIRAVQTAYPTAESKNLPVILEPDLLELETPIPGHDPDELKRLYPLCVPCVSEPSLCGGTLLLNETTHYERHLRGKRVIDYLKRTYHGGEHIMIVSHAAYFGYLLRNALDLGMDDAFHWRIENAHITEIKFFENDIPLLEYANRDVE